ncbi:MAG TPA: CSLREA domain-containing protein, partial [Dehalococcoidia bacterium]|nr:CSLREA domain-containing protein [Dehalococcoidia bacterium]
MYVRSDRKISSRRGALVFALGVAVLALVSGGHGPAYAATINVNTFTDELNSDGDCSLREAIRASNTALAVDACPAGGPTTDIINLQPGTYTLTLHGAGEDLAATGDLDITTPTPSVGNLVNIVGNGAIIDGDGADRVFDMYDALPKASTLTMSNLTVRNGNPGLGNGGAIRGSSGDSLNLTNVVVSGSASGLSGGGISNTGFVNLTNVTISGNSAAGVGGGFQNAAAGSSLIANGTTISGNDASGTGGAGVYNESSATASMTNVTISGNTATGTTSGGGGLHNRTGGAVSLINVTVTGNSAGFISPGGGGGIKNNGTGTVNIKNTIVAGNTSALGADCNGTLNSQGHNLFQATVSPCTISGVTTGNITGQDPLLGPLAANGGPTQTHALPANSPAVNAGDNAGCPIYDQRGVERAPYAPCDIGAYE